ncbi:MAG: glycosyltransferase [Sulfurimonas sp.]|nr:glycosyltransferase [Sulfurimonas sp.]
MNISVVIPTYNRYEVLQRALKSVYSQIYSPKEVIIIDDGSIDETSQIQKLFPQKAFRSSFRVTYYYQENSGVSSARNLGIKKSKCEWIAFLDSDDEWHGDKLKFQVDFHKKSPDIKMSYTNEIWIRDGNEVKLPKKYQKYGGDIFAECLSHCIIAPSATLIHKSLLENIGLFDESLEVCEDYDMWLRVALENKIGLIDKKLTFKYGGDKDQLSMKYWGMDRFRVQALEKLLKLELTQEQKDLVTKNLLDKYTLLLKGAVKYDRMLDIEAYKIKIKRYEN